MTAQTVRELLVRSTARLEAAGVDSPRLSAELLVGHGLGLDRLHLLMDADKPLGGAEMRTCEALVARRETGEPAAYILGRREFFGLDFKVGPGVLVPRPETEHLIEKVEEIHTHADPFTFADLGCGSGIIAVTIAVLFPKATGVAVDLSDAALGFSRRNAQAHGVEGRVRVEKGDFTTRLFEADSLDLVVSNPPYVTDGEYGEVSREVRDFEPRSALTSGPDGLDHVRALLPEAVRALRPGGWLVMEIGWQQGRAVLDVLSTFPELTGNAVQKDLSGHDRVVVAKKQ